MPYGTLNADTITNSNGLSGNAIGPGFKNRIINGDMRIDQRNAGATVSTSSSYPVDRFYVVEGTSATFTSQRSTTAPTGFTNSLLFTVGTGASAGAAEQVQIRQAIEGFNIADLAWGTANAKSVTISFQVRSSVTGTYCVFLQSSDGGVSYVATYTISAANTFESKSITITGPTSGTFSTDNSLGVLVGWDLGSGSNFNTTAGSWQSGQYRRTTAQANFISNSSATFYITGVQLEVAPSATSFDYRPYGTELMLCQRYYYRTALLTAGVIAASAFATTTVGFSAFGSFPVRLRTNPSALETSGTATDYQWNGASTATCNAVPTFSTRTSTDMWQANGAVASGLTAGQGGSFVTPSGNGYMAWSAEL
jgi:hypothetical protein